MVPGGVRTLVAPNPGSFTLDGTRTYIVGAERLAIVDPGPNVDSHVQAIADAVSDAVSTVVLVTHRHADHAEAAPVLGELLGVRVFGFGGNPINDGDTFSTDRGSLRAVSTPGHTEEHWAFWWDEAQALFAGDLILGKGNTTWIGEYGNGVSDYLDSLDRIRRLSADILFPGHGDPIGDPEARIQAFRDHRLERVAQVREALAAHPGASADELITAVYGMLPPDLHAAAVRSLQTILDYLEGAR